MKKINAILFAIAISMNWISHSQITLEVLKDINVSGESYASHFKIYNDKMYFTADDGENGKELWRTDGTEGGTGLFFEFNPVGTSYTKVLGEVGGELFVGAATSDFDVELWKTDGTESGTELVKDIRIGTGGSDPIWLGEIDGKMYFAAFDGIVGDELWVTEGTEASTNLLKDIQPGLSGSEPRFLLDFNNEIYFSANDGIHGFEIWKTDGSIVNTVMLKDVNEGSLHGSPLHIIEFGGKIYFSGKNATEGEELWISDGTEEGTVSFMDINSSGSSYPSDFTVYNDKLYFRADDGIHGTELWVTDGTVEGTQMLIELRPGGGFLGGAAPRSLVVAGGTLFFQANSGEDGDHDLELWKTNGFPDGTVRVKDINPTGSSSPSKLIKYGNKIYFKAWDGTNGNELWYSDGTEEGTQKVTPVDGENVNPLGDTEFFFEFDGSIYFIGNYNELDKEIWKLTDETASIEKTDVTLDFKVYPNPASDILYITSKGEIEAIKIINLSGKIIQTSKGTGALSIRDLSPGVYFVQVRINGKLSVAKFIKNH